MSAPPEQADRSGAAAGADPGSQLQRHWRRTRMLTAVLLCLWFGATFGVGFFARDLEHVHFFGWPLSYYMGAQGSLLVFLLIIGGYALAMRRIDAAAGTLPASDRDA